MTNEELIAELSERLKEGYKEWYEVGRMVGLKEGHQEGYAEGLTAGYEATIQAVKTSISGIVELAPVIAKPEPVATESEPAKPLAPYLQKALAYVKQHPGASSHQARHVIRNTNALHILARRGLLEKRGAQFYPLGETPCS